MGETGSDYGLIDDLAYQYSGNQLQKVDDANNIGCQNNGFSDNGSFQPIEYLYDPNGNMITDLNKEILNIAYDYNNLPQLIELSATGSQDLIYYWYDADGVKLRKQTRIDQAIVATTDYVGSFVYEDNTLQYILTDEGRIVYDRFNDTYQYQYFLKDHLGNTRILFDENGIVLQDNSYYPFGMAIDALCQSENFTPDNNYLYNGKELQDDFGLEWYDYGARFYDPQLGRWHVIDPMARRIPNLTPYNYVRNNPIYLTDPDGRADDKNTKTNPNANKTENRTHKTNVPASVIRTSTKISVSNKDYWGMSKQKSSIKGSSDNIKNISNKSATIISKSLEETGNTSAIVTSTMRTPEKQASIMYDNALKDGANAQKDMYGTAGDKVINTFESYTPEWNCSKAEALEAMTITINEVGPQNVSRHTGDPTKLNVIDISTSTISDGKAFHNSIHNNPGINKAITPYDKKAEKAFHVEIPQ